MPLTRNWFRWAANVLLVGCIDYQPSGKPDESLPDGGDLDSGKTDSGITDADSASTPEEVCDGVDNDDDGAVDEGFSDADHDDVADCIDDSCVVPLDAEQGLSDTFTCERDVAPAAEPWAVELLWELDLGAHCLGVVGADLDGDGAVELACVDSLTDRLQLIDGPSGNRTIIGESMAWFSGVAMGDLDRDGGLEVVVYASDGGAVALRKDGTELWRSPVVLPEVGYEVDPIEITDMDSDGRPEVIGQYAVLRDDGRFWRNVAYSAVHDITHEELAVADLDLNGDLDMISGWTRFRSDGSVGWEYTPSNDGRWTAIPLLLQADADEEAEVLLAGDEFFALFEADGSVVVEHEGAMYGSFPCAGDMDGDGDMDLLVMGWTGSRAWSLPRTVLWDSSYVDVTETSVGCTTFDFDLDGRKEVVYGDGEALRILDGSTGSPLYEHLRMSRTFDDRVLILDLDGDGSVEIVSSTWGGGYGPMLRAYGNVNRDWPPGTQMWPSATWSGTSLLPDGRVPRTPQKPWLTTKVWRGQPEVPVFGSDLRPAVGDTCVSSCEDDGEVRVEVRLENLGPDESEAGAPLSVYGLDASGARVLLSVLALTDWLDDGRAAPSWEVVTTTAQAERGLVFVAGDDGTGAFVPDDCETSNNEVAWALTACP